MPPNCASDIIEHQKSFRIKHEDDKFFTRLLSKENSKSSFRVYYGDVSSAVPFTWETCPGTPKHNSSSSSSDHHHLNLMMPPLTPPPSYFNNNNNLDNDSFKRNSSRSKILLHNLLRRMNPKKLPSSCHVAPTSSSPHDVISSSSISSLSSWSSSARSSFSDPISTPNVYVRKRRRFSSWGSSFDDRASAISSVRNDDVSPPANSCFGIGKDKSDGGYSVFIVKKAFLSIVGRGRASSA